MQGILGVDIGTSATEGCLVNLSGGKVISRIQVNYPPGFANPEGHPNGAEQRAEVWIKAAMRVLNELSRTAETRDCHPKAVAVSSMVGGLNIPVDRDWKPLRSVPIWLDRRAVREAGAVAAAIPGEELGRVTGNADVTPYFGFTKLLWYISNDLENFRRTHALLTPHGAVVRMLTGEHVTDTSSLGAFGGVLDPGEGRVSEPMLRRLSEVASDLAGEGVEVVPELFGEVVAPDSIVGKVTSAGSGVSGVVEGIPVAASGVDAAVALLASGGRMPGDNTLLMGTSWCLGLLSARRSAPPATGMVHMPHVWKSASLDFSMTGGSYTGGTAGFWMPELVVRTPFEDLEREANMVPPGSDGVVFLPYLMGDRTPLGRPELSGAFLGLRAEHNRGHMFRAVMEGGAMQHAECMVEAEASGVELAPTRVVDGVYRSPLWRVMVADISRRTVLYHPKFPGVSYGDAMLAALAAGLEHEEAVFAWVPEPRRIEPSLDPDVEAAYAGAMERYRGYKDALCG
jgi:xylulokinase